MNNTSKTKIIIVGGGFAGVRLARNLMWRDDIDITLISDRDYFAYYPQLYHAATGGVRSASAISLGSLFADTPVEVVIDSVTKVDAKKKLVHTASKLKLDYNYLALAVGNVTNYFGIAGLEEYSYNIKSIEGAEAFKAHIYHDVVSRGRIDANYVIVGAGPTGVELAAALGGYVQRLSKLHSLKPVPCRIELVEAAPKVLPRSSDKVSERVKRRLEKLGVTVLTGEVVQGETVRSLQLKGRNIASRTVVWTAGVANNPLFKAQEKQYEILPKGGKIKVNQFLQSKEGTYVLGDNAATQYSGLAQTAVNDANFVASDIERQLDGSKRKPYKPKKPIVVTPVGKNWAVVEYGKFSMTGYLPWLLRRASDLIAYSDIESLPKAIMLWLLEPHHEDSIRTTAKMKSSVQPTKD